ncbi:MAG TPA: hypothetical protein VE967_12340 [Gemmatimonadaceae bacterium]|nr:hypothetical protein [Gemmatimonadaceae bacterium]
MRGRWAPILLLAIGGCAYYNGVYNAKAAAARADRRTRRGDSYGAQQGYDTSAAKAETVLARHPKSRWRNEALYLAGRGLALKGNDCARGMRRLDEYLSLQNEPESRRERALIARASCMLSGTEALAADTMLRPLLESKDPEVRAEAALWDGRVALFLGDANRAEELLSKVPGNAASWEYMTASFARGDFARAESLLVQRATVGDYRPEVRRHITTLWMAGHHDAAARIVDLYGASGAPTTERVQLRFRLSDLAAGVGDTALARRQASEALRFGFSGGGVETAAQARLLALRIREFDALPDIEAAIARDSAHARGDTLLKRMTDDITIMHLLLANPDVSGAATFLAAEIARDSLHANRLAHAMFRAVERDYPDYEIAARALLAARAIVPESTKVYEARIMQRWDSSSAAFALRGLDPSRSKQRLEDAALTRAWQLAMRFWSDTLKARHIADSIALVNGTRRQ